MVTQNCEREPSSCENGTQRKKFTKKQKRYPNEKKPLLLQDHQQIYRVGLNSNFQRLEDFPSKNHQGFINIGSLFSRESSCFHPRTRVADCSHRVSLLQITIMMHRDTQNILHEELWSHIKLYLPIQVTEVCWTKVEPKSKGSSWKVKKSSLTLTI